MAAAEYFRSAANIPIPAKYFAAFYGNPGSDDTGMLLAVGVRMHTQHLTAADALLLVQAEYLEIPGLRLTEPQVERLWGIDPDTTKQLLRVLVDIRFLRQTRDGAYIRANHDQEAAHRTGHRRAGRFEHAHHAA